MHTAYKIVTPELMAEAFRISESLRIGGWIPREGRFKYSWEECAKATIDTLDLDPRWWVVVYYMQIIHSSLIHDWSVQTREEQVELEG